MYSQVSYANGCGRDEAQAEIRTASEKHVALQMELLQLKEETSAAQNQLAEEKGICVRTRVNIVRSCAGVIPDGWLTRVMRATVHQP